MLTEEQIRAEIAKTIEERDKSRQELISNRHIHPDLYHSICLRQAIILGKLGGLYTALGNHPNLINQMVADPYWQGLTDQPQRYDPNLQ